MARKKVYDQYGNVVGTRPSKPKYGGKVNKQNKINVPLETSETDQGTNISTLRKTEPGVIRTSNGATYYDSGDGRPIERTDKPKINEQALRQALNQRRQTIVQTTVGGGSEPVSSNTLDEARQVLERPREFRSLQDEELLRQASGLNPDYDRFVNQRKPFFNRKEEVEVKDAIQKFREIFNPNARQEALSEAQKNKIQELIDRLFRTTDEARNLSREGKISGGLQEEGQVIQNVGNEIISSQPRKLNFFSPTNTLGSNRTVKGLVGGIVKGVGETVESGGVILEAASKKESYETIFGKGVEAATYFINVGRTATITPIKLNPAKGEKQTPIVFSKQTQADAENTGKLLLATGGAIGAKIIANPAEEGGKLVGSGLIFGGAASLGNKIVGSGKATIAVAKGGKYIPEETLYETNPANLLQGKYPKGTPKSMIKGFKQEGSQKKRIMHSAGTDPFVGKKTMKVQVPNPEQLPMTDPKGMFYSTKKAAKVYLRVSGSTPSLVPRIPFVNAPGATEPTTLIGMGTTTPRKLTTLGKVKNLKQGKKLFEEANVSKNIPFASPANTLQIKAENEALLREGAVLTKRVKKGKYDFSFVEGTFVKTPTVRIMPSKPRTIFNKKPKVKKIKNVDELVSIIPHTYGKVGREFDAEYVTVGSSNSGKGTIVIPKPFLGIKTKRFNERLLHEFGHKLDRSLFLSEPSQYKKYSSIKADFVNLSKKKYGLESKKRTGKLVSFLHRYPESQRHSEILAEFSKNFPEEILKPTTKTGRILNKNFTELQKSEYLFNYKIKPTNKIIRDTKTRKEISFSSSISQSQRPKTPYYLSLFKKSSSTSSRGRPSRIVSSTSPRLFSSTSSFSSSASPSSSTSSSSPSGSSSSFTSRSSSRGSSSSSSFVSRPSTSRGSSIRRPPTIPTYNKPTNPFINNNVRSKGPFTTYGVKNTTLYKIRKAKGKKLRLY